MEATIPVISPNRPVNNPINDNYCLVDPQVDLSVEDPLCQNLNKNVNKTVNLPVVGHVPYVTGQSENKDLSPSQVPMKIKCVKPVCCVNPCLCAPTVQNVSPVVENPPVGARLQRFWQVWHSLGANPRVVSILQEGYNLPFKEKPPLTRSPVIISGYANPVKSRHIKDSLQALIQKQAVEKVTTPSSLAFYNRLFLVPKPNRKWRPILDLSRLNCYLATSSFKMETPETIRLSLQKGEWVTSLDFSDAYFHIPIGQRSRKFLRFFLHGQAYQFTALPFGLSTAPLEFTKVAKEVKLMAQARGIRIHQYLDDWLLRAPCPETCLLHTRTLLDLCHRLGWVVNMTKSELVPQQVFNFVGYRFDLSQGLVKPTQERWVALSQKINDLLNRQVCSVRQFMSLIGLLTATEKQVVAGRLHMRPIQWHLKRHWHVPESLEKIIPLPQALHTHLRWWLSPKKCPKRSAFTPTSARSSAVYRRLKRRLGCSLRRLHSKRPLVHTRKRLSYKLAGTQGCLTSSKTVRAIVLEPDHSGVFRQHNSGLVHKQGGRYEIRLSLCSPLEAADVVQPEANRIKGKTYSGSPQCHCGQVVPARSGDTNGMVPPARSLRPDLQKMAQAGGGPICDQVQSQTSQVCVPGSGSASLESGCPQRSLARSGCLCFSPGGPPGEGGLQVDGSRIPQSHSHCTRVAQHVMVLGSGQHVSTDSPKSSESREPVDSTLQSVSSQGPSQSEPACMAPRAFAIQQAGFSEEVATRIEAPQRRSTRAIYESKWSVFVRWCEEHKVDFRSPSIKQISDFLLYLFQEKHLQPSTIDGYRTAISDKIGNGRVNIGKDENLTRLLDSFHRDKPKGRRGVPSWNLSLVLHQLTKPPFEPLRKASLKHLTFKTVFLLALGSGKRRSEIHAWVHRNIRHQEDWSNVSLYPSPSFISKNHLAKEGPGCVAPVIIPALAPTLDKSLKEDRTLCPVRSLRYYLDKTKDLRSDKELVFISFRKSFTKDIVPATVSSWIKQTIGLCYQLSDEQSQNLHQVRAHDVRAFAASKAFQGGVPLDQILSACHWKSHNTFTQFYLKDVAWADSELYHLGPVVAAQQIRD